MNTNLAWRAYCDYILVQTLNGPDSYLSACVRLFMIRIAGWETYKTTVNYLNVQYLLMEQSNLQSLSSHDCGRARGCLLH